MTKNKNHHNNGTDSSISPDDPAAKDMETIAARYLDLWQDNLRRWTTTPDRVRESDD